MKWLPRSASESAFPSMIDTFFDRAVPLKGASVAPGTYVQTSIACTKVVFTWVSYRDEHGPSLAGRPPRNLAWCLWLPSPRRPSARLPTVRLPPFHPPLRQQGGSDHRAHCQQDGSSAFSPCRSCTCFSATRNSCSFTHPSRPTLNTRSQFECPQHQNCSSI